MLPPPRTLSVIQFPKTEKKKKRAHQQGSDHLIYSVYATDVGPTPTAPDRVRPGHNQPLFFPQKKRNIKKKDTHTQAHKHIHAMPSARSIVLSILYYLIYPSIYSAIHALQSIVLVRFLRGSSRAQNTYTPRDVNMLEMPLLGYFVK